MLEANAIQVAARIPEEANVDLFLGDGQLAASPSPAARVLQQQRESQGDNGSAPSSGSGGLASAPGGIWREVIDVVDHRTLIFDKPDTNATRAFMSGARAPPGAKKYRDQRYAFDRVFDKTSTQEHVFENTAKPLLKGLFDGFNATVFAYGATGCGKTHTVSGTKEDPGIIYRTMRELFAQIGESEEAFDTQVTVSMLEIYNELIRDLLSDDFPACPRGGLTLREDERNRITVAGLTSKAPKSAEEVLEFVLLGNSRRTSSPTHANAQSSRSHAVLQVNVSRRPKGGDTVDLETSVVSTSVTSATLSIIDLAGSERASATQNMGNRMKEGANINKSLLALGNCINALCVAATRGASSPHIPYRDSKLTRLLKFSLGGNCRTVMIVCVSPCSVHLEDTGNTLKYANRAKNIVTKVSRNLNGVERNITQYLTAIAEKDATIKLLEAKLADKTGALTAAQQRRQQEARAEMAQLKAEMQAKTIACLPIMTDGAAAKAYCEASDLKIAVMRHRVADIDEDEDAESFSAYKSALVNLISQLERKMESDSEAKQKLSSATKQSSFLDALLRSMQERKFDKLEQFEVDSLRLEARLRRAEADLALSQAKERSYRTTISEQAEIVTSLIGGLIRGEEAQTVLQQSLRISVSPDQVRNIRNALSKRAPIVRPQAASSVSLTRASPAVRRILQSAASPAKRLLSSPARKRPPILHNALRGKGSAGPKKVLRWKDEAGAGRIDDALTDSDNSRLVASSSEDSPPTTPKAEDEEWVDDGPIEPSIHVEDAPLGGLTRPLSSTEDAVPAWKLNRMALGRAKTLAIEIVADDSVSSGCSSPEIGSAARPGPTRFGNMGPPSRPLRGPEAAPLQPSRATNLRSVQSAGNLGLSTRNHLGLPAAPTPMRPNASHSTAGPSRRISSIGPVRSEKKRSRPSVILPALDENVPPVTAAAPSRRLSASVGVSTKVTIEGPSSFAKTTLSSILSPGRDSSSPKKTLRRSSIRPGRPSLLNAPRSIPSPTQPAGTGSESSTTSRLTMPTAASAARAIESQSVRRVSSVGGAFSLAGQRRADAALPSVSENGNASIPSTAGEPSSRSFSMRSLNLLAAGAG